MAQIKRISPVKATTINLHSWKGDIGSEEILEGPYLDDLHVLHQLELFTQGVVIGNGADYQPTEEISIPDIHEVHELEETTL